MLCLWNCFGWHYCCWLCCQTFDKQGDVQKVVNCKSSIEQMCTFRCSYLHHLTSGASELPYTGTLSSGLLHLTHGHLNRHIPVHCLQVFVIQLMGIWIDIYWYIVFRSSSSNTYGHLNWHILVHCLQIFVVQHMGIWIDIYWYIVFRSSSSNTWASELTYTGTLSSGLRHLTRGHLNWHIPVHSLQVFVI